MSEIGRPRPVLEARSKVDGTADYVINHVRSRMLQAAIVRSTRSLPGSTPTRPGPAQACIPC